MMDRVKLQHFVTVVDHRHFGRAAEALGISQQAVSRNIAALERSLGVPLLERGRFGATPTAYGAAFAARARTILAEFRLGESEVAALRGAWYGELRVGVGLSFSGRIMPLALQRFRRAHPRVHVTAVVESSAVLFPMLARGELEFCASAPPASFAVDPDLLVEPLFVELDAVIVRAQHPLSREARPSFERLREFPWLMSAQLAGSWEEVCGAFSARGIAPPDQLVRTDSLGLAKELLLADDFLVMLGRENVAREVAAGLLTEVDLPPFLPPRPASITRRRSASLSPPAARLADIVRVVALETRAQSGPQRTIVESPTVVARSHRKPRV